MAIPKEEAARIRLQQARIGRLATVDAAGRPVVVPICFVLDGDVIYSAIDRKPKDVGPRQIARVRHIIGNPEVALVVDRYVEDWARLWYVLVRGRAAVLQDTDRAERDRAISLLKQKYRQYRRGLLAEDALIIRIVPIGFKVWGNLG